MKKVFLLISGILIATCSFAGSNDQDKMVGIGKGMISNGFFINLGFAFPSQTLSATKIKIEDPSGTSESTNVSFLPSEITSSQSLGFQPSIEIGNQWYFWKDEKMGFGLRVSWFQFGFSSSALNYRKGTADEMSASHIDLRFLKLAPQFTLGLNDDMALDLSFEIAPTILISAATKQDNVYASASAGVLFAPGVKFRYRKFAVGFDFGFGSLGTTAIYTSGNNTTSKSIATVTGSSSIIYPRFYLGLNFSIHSIDNGLA